MIEGLSLKGALWRNTAGVACFLFGLALLVNTHPLGDGLWFWYADALRHGIRLYRDLHLALQPLFVLQTKWTQQLFGVGWLIGKLPASLELAMFCLGLRLMSGFVPWPDWEGGALLAVAFCLSALFSAYRVDDYHVIADSLQVFSIVLLLRLDRAGADGRPARTAAMIGLLIGLSLVTRLNDGGLLLITVASAFGFVARSHRVLSVCVLLAAATAAVLLVVFATGDTVHDWATNSIFHAAASKGGPFAVLRAPLKFPFVTVKLLLHTPAYRKIFASILVVIACVLWLRYKARDYRTGRVRIVQIIGPVLLLAAFAPTAVRQMQTQSLATGLAGIGMLLAILVCCWILARLTARVMGHAPASWREREVLLLIPMGQMLSTAMSSGGRFESMTGPFGIFLLLFPICSPYRMRKAWQQSALMVPVVASILSIVVFKYQTPYSWHTYIEAPMFQDRVAYRHPLYGPMVVEQDNLRFMEALCRTIHSDNSEPDVLSLPFPYPNYFCGVAPWHGYVQSFFDTTNLATIDRMMDELRTAPPKWIVYQRQLGVLRMHEDLFNHGQPLPQRFLDTFVEGRMHSGAWTLVSEQDIANTGKGFGAEWLLIRTGP